MTAISAMPPLLDVRDLRVTFAAPGRSVTAVDGVSFAIAAGESVGIVGESGSGKSTFARSLLALLPGGHAPLRAGSIAVDGKIIPFDRLATLRGHTAAMIFQDPLSYLNPLMSVGKQIGEAVSLHDRAVNRKRRVMDLLELVRLPRAMHHAYPHELSGGMRQRVLIAIALACKPRLLIADEPTTALDVTTQSEILRLISDVRSEFGMALLLISHDLGVVSAMCESVNIMYRGKIIERGATQALFRAPVEPYTRQLIAAAEGLQNPGIDQAVYDDPMCFDVDESGNSAGLSFDDRLNAIEQPIDRGSVG